MASIPSIKCPHCDARAAARSSKGITRTTRDIYFQCSDVECGHTFLAQLTVVRTISLSAKPRAGMMIPFGIRPGAAGATATAANDDTGLPKHANDAHGAAAAS